MNENINLKSLVRGFIKYKHSICSQNHQHQLDNLHCEKISLALNNYLQSHPEIKNIIGYYPINNELFLNYPLGYNFFIPHVTKSSNQLVFLPVSYDHTSFSKKNMLSVDELIPTKVFDGCNIPSVSYSYEKSLILWQKIKSQDLELSKFRNKFKNQKLGIMLVPALGLSASTGLRIGSGFGYYDRFFHYHSIKNRYLLRKILTVGVVRDHDIIDRKIFIDNFLDYLDCLENNTLTLDKNKDKKHNKKIAISPKITEINNLFGDNLSTNFSYALAGKNDHHLDMILCPRFGLLTISPNFGIF